MSIPPSPHTPVQPRHRELALKIWARSSIEYPTTPEQAAQLLADAEAQALEDHAEVRHELERELSNTKAWVSSLQARLDSAKEDAARLDWLQDSVGYVCFEAEDEGSAPRAVCYIPEGKGQYVMVGEGDDYREAIDFARRS